LRLGRPEILASVFKLGSAMGAAAARGPLLRHLGGRLAAQQARYRVALMALAEGGTQSVGLQVTTHRRRYDRKSCFY
jgi:hypothetical protein